jgi:phosphatidylserine/phosphatidylglycerophosphate/cardiolipin synthase-like enzyme
LKLLVQPGDGVQPLLDAINGAKNRVEIVIFRFDRGEIEKALANAAARGVFVHALIAYTNRGGEKNLRKLEMRLLDAGITVARTADDLARYHGKFLIVDRRELFLLSFNFTYLDIDHSRCFGLITSNPGLVAEAVKLFEADTKRQPYVPGSPAFVVSPSNARKQLAAFLQGAKKQLLIYDPEISDPGMLKILEARAAAGVEIRVIGRVTHSSSHLAAHKLSVMRLHTRTIIRDGKQAFIGSQSLRELELGARREVGVIFRDNKIVQRLAKTFQDDWEAIERAAGQRLPEETAPAVKVARKIAKAVARDLPPVAPVLRVLVRELVGGAVEMDLDAGVVEESVKDAVKEAVKEAVRDAVENAVEQNGASPTSR